MSDIILTDTSLPSIAGLRLSEARLPSSLDGALQPLIIGLPERPCAVPTPLLVGLHSWSADYRQQTQAFGPLCAQYGWLMVLPDFRGPNLNTHPHPEQAGGSLAAQHDIVDAVVHMRQEHDVDERRIYLIGGSGGGHMSLLMAGKYPDLWGGVSSWCPITSLQEWHEQQNGYAVHIEAVCGGPPNGGPANGRPLHGGLHGGPADSRPLHGPSREVDFEYDRRSPRTFITNAAHTPVRISHGDKDRCILPAQTWRTYEKLLDIPHRVELYSWSGGHEIVNAWGFAWLAMQARPMEPPRRLDLVSDEGKWTFWLYLEPDAPLTLATCAAMLSEEGVLELTVAHSARTEVRLDQAGRLTDAEREGQAVAPETLTPEAGLLRLPPCAEPTHWRLTFDGKAPV
jgi:pimeloyl-ACP methyl ester carboxylesterase